MVTCWIIWKARNSEIFTDSKWDLWLCLNQIYSLVDLIQKTHAFSGKQHVPKEVKWFPPQENVFKLNVDGSSSGNPGKSGFGGLLRNSIGEWIYGFLGFCGITTCLNCLWFTIAWSRGITSIICKSDSQMALQLISKGVEDFHPYAPLINRIRDFYTHPWILSFQHTLREGNFSADWLAKNGSNQVHDLVIFESWPPQLHQLFLSDALGVYRLRP